MALRVGNSAVTNVMLGSENILRIMYGSTQVWPVDSAPEASKGTIIFIHRFSSLQTYDIAFIETVEGAGYEVNAIAESAMNTVDYSTAAWVVVGAPGTNYTEISSPSTIANADTHVLSMCRYTGRITLGMAGSSGSTNMSSFRIRVPDHPQVPLVGYTDGEDINMGTNVAGQRISSVNSGFTLIAGNGTSTANSGIVAQDAGVYRRVHWGYYRFDTMSAEGKALFLETLNLSVALREPSIVYVAWDGVIDRSVMPLFPPTIISVTKE